MGKMVYGSSPGSLRDSPNTISAFLVYTFQYEELIALTIFSSM